MPALKKGSAAYEERRHKMELFLETLPKKNFHIARTCEAVGVHRNTYIAWMNTDKDFARRFREARERDLDDTEDMLRTLIKGIPKRDKEGKFIGWITPPNPTAVIFKLKTQGKDRGWIERIEMQHDGKLEYTDMSEKELDRKIKELKKLNEQIGKYSGQENGAD